MPQALDSPGGRNIFAEHLSQADGLADNSIRAVCKDRRGFMWFGTWGGLHRYDGRRIKLYANDPNDPDSISGNTIV